MQLLGGAEAVPEDILRILKQVKFFILIKSGSGSFKRIKNFPSFVFLSDGVYIYMCREILVEGHVIELNKMLKDGFPLERIIKHFFQVQGK